MLTPYHYSRLPAAHRFLSSGVYVVTPAMVPYRWHVFEHLLPG